MASGAWNYSTEELTTDTLRDFERLFEKRPAPGAFLCWCMYHHRSRPPTIGKGPQARAQSAARNRRERRKLVEVGRSHGILVYLDGEPVGWCQYGPEAELPRLDSQRRSRESPAEGKGRKRWRITCFVVETKYRKRGVASAALRAALEAIRNQGGGIVEAYPVSHWGAYRNYLGIASMFRREGFQVVAPLGKSNVVMRREI